jgi:hypothetical protein
MEYLLTIYFDESALAGTTPEAGAAMLDAYTAFGEKHAAAIQGGNGLQPTPTATSVRVRDGERLVTDGPFAETKEALGGYYLVDAANLDDAIAIAADIPGAAHGTVEVRPVMNYDAVREGTPTEVQGAQA